MYLNEVHAIYSTKRNTSRSVIVVEKAGLINATECPLKLRVIYKRHYSFVQVGCHKILFPSSWSFTKIFL